MRRAAALAAVLLLGAPPTEGQERLSIDPPSRPEGLSAEPGGALEAQAAPGSAADAPGGVVRVLDKIDGTVTDLELADGETGEAGNITVTLAECRYPAGNPAGDAFVLLSIRTKADDTAVFEGWMIASAPALNALDHPRYDVWALRCLGT